MNPTLSEDYKLENTALHPHFTMTSLRLLVSPRDREARILREQQLGGRRDDFPEPNDLEDREPDADRHERINNMVYMCSVGPEQLQGILEEHKRHVWPQYNPKDDKKNCECDSKNL